MIETCNQPTCQAIKDLFAKNDPDRFLELMSKTMEVGKCDPLWCIPLLQLQEMGKTKESEER